jgi:hypothetical protein
MTERSKTHTDPQFAFLNEQQRGFRAAVSGTILGLVLSLLARRR